MSQVSPPPNVRFRLADHVRGCRVDDQVILLDLHRNKYLGIGGPQLAALSTLIEGWPSDKEDSMHGIDAFALARWIEPLQRQSMLTDTPRTMEPLAILAEPLQSLNAEGDGGTSAFEWHQLPQLWHAALVTSLWLRRRSLAEIANDVASMRRHRDPDADDIDADTLRAAVCAYMGMRPFAFTAHDRCLHDSLTLIRFLAGRNLFPRWVIGVRTRPFSAHSWVQSGELVLNDLAENVRRYQPILVV